MGSFRQFLGRVRISVRGRNHIAGWNMTPEDATSFLQGRGKTMLTFYGYSGMGYEDQQGMLNIARGILSRYLPDKTLVVSGATRVGIGAVYPVAKSLGFETAGIVATLALEYHWAISESVDHICFIKDSLFGGKLPDSNELSPTSIAMVNCSDILVAIGGGEICRDELLEARRQGKPIQYFPAEMNHEKSIRHAKKSGLPVPESFKGAVHEVFGNRN